MWGASIVARLLCARTHTLETLETSEGERWRRKLMITAASTTAGLGDDTGGVQTTTMQKASTGRLTHVILLHEGSGWGGYPYFHDHV